MSRNDHSIRLSWIASLSAGVGRVAFAFGFISVVGGIVQNSAPSIEIGLLAMIFASVTIGGAHVCARLDRLIELLQDRREGRR